MPLRVSWSFDHKSRAKMYQQGHYARVKRPSGPELFEDASRILEELLQKQLNSERNAHSHKTRNKTHPLASRRPVTSGEVLDERDEFGLDDGIERCKTMPSRMRGASKDEPLKPKDLELLQRTAGVWKDFGEGSSASSADTEGDSSSVSEHRKKKSFFKKYKDRFLHAIHREEREKKNRSKDKDSPQNSPRKIRKKMSSKGESLDKNGVKDSQGKGDSERQGTLDSKGEGQPNLSESKRRNSAGKALLNSIRKSFRPRRDSHSQRNTLSFPGEASGEGARPSASLSGASGSSKSQSVTPSPDKEFQSQTPARPSQDGGLRPPGSSLVIPASGGRKGSSHSHHEKSPSPFPHSTSTDSHFDNGNKSSSLYSFSSAQQNLPHVKNVLDDPGDDIEFMDTAENGDYEQDDVGAGGPSGNSVSRNGVEPAADRRSTGNRKHRMLVKQSSLCVDGDDSDKHDGHGKNLQGDEGNIPFHERTAEEKNEMYKKIAQKLNDIGDRLNAESGMSDTECHAEQPGVEADGSMTDLERQIMECLRDVGDRNSNVLDAPAEEAMQKAKAEAYDRFQQTVQHALGEEVSWNQLAFLFYTTKGVVSAVGKGTRLASDAKEMTLHYFSDKFARWIMDQGGFDSVLSESDSELD